MTKKARIRLPAPHPKQREIEASTSKRKIINAGRRAGKTFMVARVAVKAASEGREVLYVAPVSKQTKAFWDLCTKWLEGAIAAGIVHQDKTSRILTVKESGGRIQAMTGKLPDNLRGGSGDYIILDEYAYQNPIIWDKVCQPMTLDTNADVWFISTPNLRNHFYLMYLRALQKDNWDVFTFSSLDNPHLSQEALDVITEDMTDVDCRQEILAEFVPGVGAVFSVDPADFIPASTDIHLGHRIIAGLDWGQKDDYTALSIGCATCQRELELHRIRKIDYPTQRDFIKGIIGKYEDVELLAESNSIGQPNIEQLWADGVEVMPFHTSNSSKAGIVQGLRLSFNQSAWKWVDDQAAWLELEGFEMRISPSGLQQFGAADGLHDDTVIARCLMLHQAAVGRFTLG